MTAITIAAITGKPQLVPHSGSAMPLIDDPSNHNSTGSLPSFASPAKGGGGGSGGGRGGGGGGGGSGGGGAGSDGRLSPNKGMDGAAGSVGTPTEVSNADGKDKDSYGGTSPQTTMSLLSLSGLKAWFGFGGDRSAKEITAHIMRRIDEAFAQVPENRSGGADVKHIAALLASVTGGRDIPKAELALVVKLIDTERNGAISKAEFASGLLLLKEDPSLSRLLGRDYICPLSSTSAISDTNYTLYTP